MIVVSASLACVRWRLPTRHACLLLTLRARRQLFDIYGNSTSIQITQKAIQRFLARQAARRQRMLEFQAIIVVAVVSRTHKCVRFRQND
jgi:hypothetical protein